MPKVKIGDHVLVIDKTYKHGQLDLIVEEASWPTFSARESGADEDATPYEFDQTDATLDITIY